MDKHFAEYINSYFDGVFVINLERNQDRRKHIDSMLENVQFEYIEAVDAKKLNLEELVAQGKYNPEKYKKFDSKYDGIKVGFLGCHMSHHKIYQKIIDQNLKRVLVFEDDAELIEENIKSMEVSIKELPSDWDICFFGYKKNDQWGLKEIIKTGLYTFQRFLGHNSHLSVNRVKNRYARPYSEHLMIAGAHDQTHAYGITQKAAKYILDNHFTIWKNFDLFMDDLCTEREVKAFITKPDVFTQKKELESEIIKINTELNLEN